MIGLSKKAWFVWQKFILPVKEGKAAQVISAERREAVIEADAFLTRYQKRDNSVYFVHEALPHSIVGLGNAGLSMEQQDAGYVATICASIQDNSEDDQQPFGFQDLHVTKKQLEGLQEAIGLFLKKCN